MPWNETDPMNERVKFIARYPQKDEPFIVLCERAGISRKTGYKWVERYEGGGVAALVERSRAPLSHPHAVPAAVIESIVATRRRHPRWGPRKLLAILRRQDRRGLGLSPAPLATSCGSGDSFADVVAIGTACRMPSGWPRTPRPMRSGVPILK